MIAKGENPVHGDPDLHRDDAILRLKTQYFQRKYSVTTIGPIVMLNLFQHLKALGAPKKALFPRTTMISKA